MGLSIADAASLVTKGYKVGELKQVSELIDQNPKEGNNIIELAKKLGFADFQNTMQLFIKPDSENKGKSENNEDETDQAGADDQAEKHNEDSSAVDQGKNDDVDYKKLYEEEKSLRTKLQQANQSADNSSDEDKKTDWEIALQAACDVLN